MLFSLVLALTYVRILESEDLIGIIAFKSQRNFRESLKSRRAINVSDLSVIKIRAKPVRISRKIKNYTTRVISAIYIYI